MSDVITIDGPVSSGKNSVALLFSKKIGYQLIDSGYIYRAFSIAVLKDRVLTDNDKDLEKLLTSIQIEYRDGGDDPRVFLDGEDITDKLHTPEVTVLTPVIAAKKIVRDIANKLQKKLASEKNTVMTGRDIGSEIFPEAKLKFYLTATPEVRARRRFEQLKEQNPSLTYEEVLEQVKERDRQDMEREVSPLRKPEDAIVIDTTNLSTEESVEEFMKYFNSRK